MIITPRADFSWERHFNVTPATHNEMLPTYVASASAAAAAEPTLGGCCCELAATSKTWFMQRPGVVCTPVPEASSRCHGARSPSQSVRPSVRLLIQDCLWVCHCPPTHTWTEACGERRHTGTSRATAGPGENILKENLFFNCAF